MAGNATYQKLFEFCAAGDRIGLADYIITSGCNLSAYDVRDSAGKTALHIACRHGHLFTVRSLIEIFGCSPAVKDYKGNLPIHDACLHGHLPVVDYLIHFKGTCIADAVLATDSEGNTLLHKACQSGSVPLVRYLQDILCYNLKKLVFTKLNLYTDSIGEYVNITPVKRLSFERTALVYCLLLPNKRGDTPLNIACRHGHLPVLKVFKAFIPYMTEYQLEVSAVEFNHIDMAAYVLSLNEPQFLEIDSECPEYFSQAQQFSLLEVPVIEYSTSFNSSAVVRKTVECQTCRMSSDIKKDDHESLTGACPWCTSMRLNALLNIKCLKCNKMYTNLDCLVDCPQCFSRLNLKGTSQLVYHSSIKEDAHSGYCPPYKSAFHITLARGNLQVFNQLQAAVKSLLIDSSSWLHAACVSDNKEIVAHVMKVLNCGPNILDSEGNTPLHVACLWGSKNVFLYLLEFESLQIGVLNEKNESPLSLACRYNQTDLCEELLKRFDCTSISYPARETPLHLACSNDNLELVKVVLENGGASFVNTADKYGDTPLFNACRCGNIKMIHQLLELNADPFHINPVTKQSPVHVACRMGLCDILKALLNTDRSSEQLFSGITPMELAIENNNPDVIILLLNKCKFDFNQALNKKYRTLAHFVAIFGHLELAKFLFKIESVDWNAQDIEGNTALHLACDQNNADMVKLIVERCGPSVVTAQNKELRIPVHIACFTGNLEILDSLLTEFSGALDSYQDVNGDTVLHIASKLELSLDIISKLCQYCSVTIKNNISQTPLHIACKLGNTPIAKHMAELFLQAGNMEDFVDENGNSALHTAVIGGFLATVNVILKYVSPVCTNKLGKTPIHISCMNGNLEVTRALLAKKAEVVYSNSGDSYLHSACYGKSLDVVKFILEESGLDCSCLLVANKLGNTPLHYACLSGSIEISSFLMKISSLSDDILKLNKEGFTPLCCLLVKGHVNTARELLLTMQINLCTKDEPLFHCIFKYSNALQTVFELFKFVVTRKISDPTLCDSQGNTVLHSFLCQISKWHNRSPPMNIQVNRVPIIFIVKEIWGDLLALPGVQLNKQNNSGDTPLHVFMQNVINIRSEERDMLEMLLTKGVSDSINTANKEGKTPIQLADRGYMRTLVNYGADPSDVNAEFRSIFERFKRDHPLDPFTKIITLGNSTAGKTTLVNTLQQLSSPNVPPDLQVADGPTAGIQTTDHTSKEFGRIRFYDFGGHPEFESGNAVFLKNLAFFTHPPIFLLLVDVQCYHSIERAAQYWCHYIKNNMPPQLEVSPHVIIVGSHSDCVDPDKYKNIKKCIKFAVEKVADFRITDVILLDCRKVDSKQISVLSSMLATCCSSLKQAIDIDCRCHVLFAHMLKWYRGHPAIKFSELRDKVSASVGYFERDVLLPPTANDLFSLLKTLHSGGYIDLLHQENIKQCWIVLDNSLLFKKVNGILFASDEFDLPKLPPTPVISEEKLVSLFGPTNLELITTYLIHSELCQRIDDQETLSLINKACFSSSGFELNSLKDNIHSNPKAEKYYFFPGLIKSECPDTVWRNSDERSSTTYCFGWYLLCQNHHFLSPRFLQVLLLRLTFNFAAEVKYSGSLADPLQRKCDIWKNGIHWSSRKGVEVLVEVVQQNTAVLLLMRFTKGCEMEGVKYRSQVIKKILDTKEEFCPKTEVAEYLLTECSKYPPSDSSFVHIAEVAQTIKEGEYCAISSTKNTIDLKALLYFDPYLNNELLNYLWKEEVEPGREVGLPAVAQVLDLQKDLTPGASECQIEWWKKEVLNQLESCSGKLSYLELRENFDAYSIFCGRNPLELSSLQEPPQQLCEKSLSGMTVHEVQTESTKSVDHQKASAENETDGMSLQDEQTISTNIPYPAASHFTDRSKPAVPKLACDQEIRLSTLPVDSSCTLPVGSSCNPTRRVLSIQTLKEEFHIRDNQLDQRIESHTNELAKCFDNVDDFIDVLPGLVPGEKTDICRTARDDGTIPGMKKALKLVLKKNPFLTFRELVEIALKENNGMVATRICRFCKGSLSPDHSLSPKRQRTMQLDN